jgi:broad specificity phosphatase PhoE
MDIYFVRHGETASNVSKRHQPSHSRLTTRGREQAAAVAPQLVALQPTHFFSSSQVRAVETAEIIGSVLDFEPQVEQVFAELNRPRHMYGWHHRDPRSLWYLALWYVGLSGAVDDQEAGESYQSLRRRIAKAQTLLASLPDDARVIVVSHSVFINMFLAHMCRPHALRPWNVIGFLRRVFRTNNTDVRHIRYHKQGTDRGCAWQEITE